jgi:hypothetical protein
VGIFCLTLRALSEQFSEAERRIRALIARAPGGNRRQLLTEVLGVLVAQVRQPAAALHAEPEAIDEGTQRRFWDESRRTYEALKAEELAKKASRSRGGRLKKVDQDARKRGVDIHRHLVAIEREITLAEQLVHPATRRLNAS